MIESTIIRVFTVRFVNMDLFGKIQHYNLYPLLQSDELDFQISRLWQSGDLNASPCRSVRKVFSIYFVEIIVVSVDVCKVALPFVRF